MQRYSCTYMVGANDKAAPQYIYMHNWQCARYHQPSYIYRVPVYILPLCCVFMSVAATLHLCTPAATNILCEVHRDFIRVAQKLGVYTFRYVCFLLKMGGNNLTNTNKATRPQVLSNMHRTLFPLMAASGRRLHSHTNANLLLHWCSTILHHPLR